MSSSNEFQQPSPISYNGRFSRFQNLRLWILFLVFGSLGVRTFFSMKFYSSLSWEELLSPTVLEAPEIDNDTPIVTTTNISKSAATTPADSREARETSSKNKDDNQPPIPRTTYPQKAPQESPEPADKDISDQTADTSDTKAQDDEDTPDNTQDEETSQDSQPESIKHNHNSNSTGTIEEEEDDEEEQDDNPLPPSAEKRRRIPPTKIAYAFFLGGIPSPSQNNDDQLQPALGRRNQKGPKFVSRHAYRGLLYNILVSVQILRDSGSKADFVLLVQMAEANVELPSADVRLVTKMGIRLKYCPPPYDAVNEVSTIPMEKFRILDLVEYARVLYMDADVTPRCNLDYLMELSIPSGDNTDPLLKENVLISIGDTPASSKMFVLAPGPGKFWKLAKTIPPHTSSQGSRHGFRSARGWGDGPYAWHAVSGRTGNELNFPGADTDQGLLFQHAKHSQRDVSIIRGTVIENWSASPAIADNSTLRTLGKRYESSYYWWSKKTVARINHPLVNNPLKEYSCSAQGPTANQTEHQHPADLSPPGIPPYQDFIQWGSRQGLEYPWNRGRAPLLVNDTSSLSNPSDDWFRVLRRLDRDLLMGLGLHQYEGGRKESEGKWKRVPPTTPSPFDPMWSEDSKALRQWANRIVDTSNVYLPWQPPIVQQYVDDHPLRRDCQCPKRMATDLCSASSSHNNLNHTNTIQEWLSNRVPYYLSKQRPLCPKAARHTIHVVLPFYNRPLETMRQSICSVACQEYSAEKIIIYAFDYGSTENTHIIDGLKSLGSSNSTSSHKALTFKLLKGVVGGKFGGIINEKEMNAHAKEQFMEYMSRYYNQQQESTGGPSLVRVKVKFHKQVLPGGSIFWALRMVQEYAGPNDIMLVLEGQLVNPKALAIINDKFVSEGALLTYGSYDDKDADPSSMMPREHLEMTRKFKPRINKPPWCFGGPWSFKVHMLQDVSIKDFTHKNGDWFVESANRGYFYRILERAREDRALYISQPIARRYEKLRPPKKSHPHFKQVTSLDPSSRWNSPTTMIMVRPASAAMLNRQLGWLQGQSMAKKRMMALHVLKESEEQSTWVDDTVANFKQEQEKNFKDFQKMRVIVASVDGQLNAFTRFDYVRHLQAKTRLDTVIFLDSDQYWDPTFIESLKRKHKPKSMTSYLGKSFTEPHSETGVAELTNSRLKLRHLARGSLTKLGRETGFTYSSHGGAIFDSNLWLFDQHLFRIEQDVIDYRGAHAVWVAYVMDALLGWDQQRLFMETPPVVSLSKCSENDPEYNQIMCSQLPQQAEAARSEMATTDGPLLDAVNAEGSDAESDLFADLQSKLHWNVIRPHGLPPTIADEELMSGTKGNNSRGFDGGEKEKRAFVCITGQLERVELQNKIKNVFLPLQKVGYEIDVALALTAGSAVFTNQQSKKSNNPFYTSFDAAVNDLTKHKFNVLTQDGPHRHWANPTVSKDYISILYNGQKHHRSYMDQIERGKNHMRIFDSYRKCLDHADRAATSASSTLEDYYSVIIRIREDIGFKTPLDGSKSKRKALFEVAFPPPPASIIVTKCRSWLGMNDRFAIVSPDIARAYFLRPLDIMRVGKVYDHEAVRNPESLLLYTYSIVKFKVLGHPDLHGLRRMYKKPNGEAMFNKDDVSVFERCPKPDLYRLDRFQKLYSWTL